MRAAEIHEEPDGPEVVRFIIVHCSIVHDVVLWVDVCMWIGVCVCVCVGVGVLYNGECAVLLKNVYLL